MARPKPDPDKVRKEILDCAEVLLEKSGGTRLVLSDIARTLGVSQSYIHLYFSTKNDLVAALAERWFAEVELATAKVATSQQPVEIRIREFVLTMMRIKRERFDRDPSVFMAYLELAKSHMELVRKHGETLSGQLGQIVGDLVPEADIPETVQLIEDATVAFRNPYMIALNRHAATDERANAVIDLLLERMTAPCKSAQ